MVEGHCVRCGEKREMKEPRQEQMKNGRPVIKGNCTVCNCKMCRIGSL